MARFLRDSLRRLFRRRYPTVRQYDRTDCGAASLLSVLRYHGGDASLVAVRELSKTGIRGTTMWSLQQAAERLGMKASGARGSYEDLTEVRLPCVAHLVLEDGRQHFVVIYRAKEKKLLVGDPARGLSWQSRETFCDVWRSGAVLLLSPTDKLHRATPPHWVAWVFRYFRRQEVWLTQSLCMGFVHVGLGLLTAIFVRSLIDKLIPSGSVKIIVAAGAGLLVLQMVRGGVGYVRSWLLIELSRRVNTVLTKDALGRLFRLPSTFFDSRRTGDITARLNDSVQIHATLLRLLGQTTIDVVAVLGSLVILLYLAPLFVWVALIFLSILGVVAILSARRMRDHHYEVKKHFARVQSSYIDGIRAIEPIRAANSAAVFGGLLGSMYEYVQMRLARLGILQTRVSVVVELATGGLVVFALTAGAVLVVQGEMTLGVLMAAYSLLAGIVPAAARIFESQLQIHEASVAAMRLLDLLLVAPECDEGIERFKMSHGVFIEGGSFSWACGRPLLSNVDIQIPRGRLTALCGPSGVGKSTLVKILERRYQLNEGRMLVDSTPVEEIALGSYRKHVATLPESVSIINGTIGDNILLGRQARGHHELTSRIESLGLGRLMSRFPNGLSTLVGEQGLQLSSGEEQAIGLLRAMWDLPDVLLVDEGINAVDVETSQIIFSVLERYAKDHAVLLVSHQPRFLLKADHIYVLADGGISESGKPDTLLSSNSKFATLVSADIPIPLSA